MIALLATGAGLVALGLGSLFLGSALRRRAAANQLDRFGEVSQ